MKKALPVSLILFLLSLGISVSFLFPLIGETVSGASLLQPSEPERDILLLAQAEPPASPAVPEQRPAENLQPAPAGTAPQPLPEGMPAGTQTPAPQEAKPEEAGQPGVEGQQPPGRIPRVVPRREQPSRRGLQQAGGPVSFFFDDADVYEVVQTVFGDILKANYIIDQKVKGKVTFRTISPVPREEVLPVMEMILRINGIGFVEEKGIYRIVPLTDVPKELIYAQVGKDPSQVAIEMFTFKNLNLKESMTDIENAIGLNVQAGTVRILPILRLNALLAVTSSKEQMEYVRKWIEAFDNMFAYARPKVMVYPLQNSKAPYVSSMLQSILGGGGGGGGGAAAPAPAPAAPRPTTGGAQAAPAAPAAPRPSPAPSAGGGGGGGGFLVSPDTKIFADEINNTLIILATPGDYAFIEETLKKIDVAPRQVMIEGLIVRVALDDNLSFGFAWSINTDVNISGIKPFVNPINLTGDARLNPGLTGDDPPKLPSGGFTFVGRDPTNHIRAIVTALENQSKARVLAAPHILVSDNREARIQVGSQIPIATSTTSQVTTTTVTGAATAVPSVGTSTIQYKDIGIILKVKPQVNDSGLISLEISQEVSSIAAQPVQVGGLDEVAIDKIEATTNLVAQDGETIVIGGLIREDTTKSKTGIPFLSRIPVIGYLFSSSQDEKSRTELIILLTPHVTRNQAEAGKVTSDYVERYKSGAKDEDIDKFIKERSQQPSPK